MPRLVKLKKTKSLNFGYNQGVNEYSFNRQKLNFVILNLFKISQIFVLKKPVFGIKNGIFG